MQRKCQRPGGVVGTHLHQGPRAKLVFSERLSAVYGNRVVARLTGTLTQHFGPHAHRHSGKSGIPMNLNKV
jgi:hypothetical protein